METAMSSMVMIKWVMRPLRLLGLVVLPEEVFLGEALEAVVLGLEGVLVVLAVGIGQD
jgi:hypothetical protein